MLHLGWRPAIGSSAPPAIRCGSAPEATVRQHRLYGWNQRANPPATGYSELGGRPWQSAQPTDLSYWRLRSELYANEPVAPRDRMMFGMLSPQGIAPGQPFKPDARQVRWIRCKGARLKQWRLLGRHCFNLGWVLFCLSVFFATRC